MWESIWNSVSGFTVLELLAVLGGVLYIVFAARESIWCWPPALFSSLIFIYIFTTSKLYFDAGLNVYYAGMAVYGYIHWNQPQKKEISITWGGWRYNLVFLSLGFSFTLLMGWLANRYTDAAFPFLDAFTTIFSLIATWMVTQKQLENWLYWIVIDGLSIYLYWQKELYFTTLLFIVYTIIAAVGFWQWKINLKNEA